MITKNLVNYQLATKGFTPQLAGGLYTYILAANGVFVYSKNEFFEVLAPVIEPFFDHDEKETVRGLEDVGPFFKIVRKVPGRYLAEMVVQSYKAIPNEALFFLGYVEKSIYGFFQLPQFWYVKKPSQLSSPMSVKSIETLPPYYAIEVHSHHVMDAVFSSMDDKEETGLRIYIVIGKVDQEIVEIRTRVGIYGHTWGIPYTWVFEPRGFIKDRVENIIIEPEAISRSEAEKFL